MTDIVIDVPPSSGPGIVADVVVSTAVDTVEVFTGVPGPPGASAGFVWFDVVNPATDVRPAFTHVMWVGGATRPVNMATGDLWVKAA
jgi:hypothetical protein